MNRNNLISLSLIISFFIVIFPKNLWANSSIVTGHVYANPNEFEYILEQTKLTDVDTIFILGDIENVILNKIKFYENLYNINIHTVPGNHEITDNKDTNNYIEKYGSYRSFTEQNQLNILLNTMDSNGSKFSHGGYSIQGKQLRFLQETLEAAPDDINTINIFMHHALFLDGLTDEEQENIANNRLNKINTDKLKEHAKEKKYFSFLSNHLVSNSWHKDVYPILERKLEEGKKINVFSGDNSISAIFQHNKVTYHLTGLRQYFKKPFHENNMQSYLLCENDNCEIIFFKNQQPELSNYHNFLYKLDLLHKKNLVATKNIDLNKNSIVYFGRNITNGYIFLEKDKNCPFPSNLLLDYFIDGQSKKKIYTGMSTSRDRRIYLIGKKDKLEEGDNVFLSLVGNHNKDFIYLSPDSLTKPFKFKLKLGDVSGELAKVVLKFKIFNHNGEQISELAYVLFGEQNYWSLQNTIHNSIQYLTLIRPFNEKNGQLITIDNILRDHNNVASNNSMNVIKNTSQISNVAVALETWTKNGPIMTEFEFEPEKSYHNTKITMNAGGEKKSCDNLRVSLHDYDINQGLADFKKEFPSFHILLKDKNYEKLHNNIPTVGERQDREKRFKFSSVKGEININNKPFKIEMKLRGGTSFHWMYDKKSYSIKFKDNKKPEKTFYIPEKRAFFGEHLIHQISKDIGLESLETGFGELYINDKNKGLYYVMDNYDKFFLLKNNLPEANIYHTDSFGSRLAGDNLEKLNKSMFIGGVKDYQVRFNKDIDYFLKVINEDKAYLEKNWNKHFNKENIIKLLSIHLLTGTVHYDLHNMYFYINPTNGKIYFLPWDFMNFNNAVSLKQESNLTGYHDYENVSQVLSKLLEIKEVRYLRNKYINENGDSLIRFIRKYKNDSLPYIISAMLKDSTVPLSFNEGRNSLLGFMHIPQTIIENINFQTQKIKNNSTKLFINAYKTARDNVQLELDLSTFSGINIDYIKINYEDNSNAYAENKDIQLFSDIHYKQEYKSIIKIKPTIHKIDVYVDENKTVENIEIQYSNIFNKKDVKIISSNVKAIEVIEASKSTSEKLYNYILDQEGNNFTFKSKNVVLKKDLVLPKNTILNILPGTSIMLGKGVSIITYGSIIAQGTKDQKISFLPLNNAEPWGVIAMVEKDSSNIFDYCSFTGGSGAYNQGKYFSGMLSGYHIRDIRVSNCSFQGSKKLNGGDDAINIKNGSAFIENSIFKHNDGDAIDFDFVDNNSRIVNSTFVGNKNDAIDVSSSNVTIDSCIIKSNYDKGVSAGERSNINLINSEIIKNKIGIASKDESFVKIQNSKVSNNVVGVALYIKKVFYNEPSVELTNVLIEDNYLNCGTEVFNIHERNAPIITTNSVIKNTNKIYKYILKANLNGVSKRDIIRAFYDEGSFNKYIDYVSLHDCNVASP